MPMILGAIGVYLLLLVVLANGLSRRIATVSDYFLAGRQMTAWPVAISFVAAWFGAGSTITATNAYFHDGVSGAWQIALPALLSCAFITLVLARPVARIGLLSLPQAVESRYGQTGRLLLAGVLLVSSTAFIGSELMAGQRLLTTTVGLDPTLAVVGLSVAVVAYAILGGFFAVVMTDILQFGIFSTAIALLTAWVGWHWLTQPEAAGRLAAWTAAKPFYWDWTHDGWRNAMLTLTFVLGWSIAPEMWQRMSATQSPALAFRAAGAATLCLVVLYSLVAVIGLGSPALVGDSPSVLVQLALRLPHPLLVSWVLVGLIAAITSTMDSSLSVGSLTLAHDLYGRFLRPHAAEQERVWVSRAATALMIIPAAMMATRFTSILEVLWISADLYAATTFFPLMGVLFCPNVPKRAGIWGMAFGGSSTLLSIGVQYWGWLLPLPWPGWPWATAMGLTLSGLGFALGWWTSGTAATATPSAAATQTPAGPAPTTPSATV